MTTRQEIEDAASHPVVVAAADQAEAELGHLLHHVRTARAAGRREDWDECESNAVVAEKLVRSLDNEALVALTLVMCAALADAVDVMTGINQS